MNPDVFITIVFSGIAVLAVLVPLILFVPRARREGALVERNESRRPPSSAGSRSTETRSSTAKEKKGAAPVH
jgi:hypothetical protein